MVISHMNSKLKINNLKYNSIYKAQTDGSTNTKTVFILNLAWSSSWTCPCACSWQCSYDFFCTCLSLRLGMLFSTRCGSALFTIDRRSIGLLTADSPGPRPGPASSCPACACSWQCSYDFFCTCLYLRLGMLFYSFARVRPPAVGPLFSPSTEDLSAFSPQTRRLPPCPANSSEILVGAAVDSSLVRTCIRSSPSVAARERRTHTTCAM